MDELIYYKFLRLELKRFVVSESMDFESQDAFELSSSFQFGFDFEEDVVSCSCQIELIKDLGVLLSATLVCSFQIKEESLGNIMTDDKIILPIGLMTQFASLVYGSFRGVLYARTIGTSLEKFVLPPNNFHNIFKSSLTILK